MAEKEFKIDEHIVLKLENGMTNVYVGETKLLFCKYNLK